MNDKQKKRLERIIRISEEMDVKDKPACMYDMFAAFIDSEVIPKWTNVSDGFPPVKLSVLVEVETTKGTYKDVSYFWGDDWDIEHMTDVIRVVRWMRIPD